MKFEWLQIKPYKIIGASTDGCVSVCLTALRNEQTLTQIFLNKKPTWYLSTDFKAYDSSKNVWSRQIKTHLNLQESRLIIDRFNYKAF